MRIEVGSLRHAPPLSIEENEGRKAGGVGDAQDSGMNVRYCVSSSYWEVSVLFYDFIGQSFSGRGLLCRRLLLGVVGQRCCCWSLHWRRLNVGHGSGWQTRQPCLDGAMHSFMCRLAWADCKMLQRD